MNTMAERLVYARKLRNLTQKGLAEASHVSRDVIASIEIGRNKPQEVAIASISNALGISREWLKHGVGPMEAGYSRSLVLDELRKVASRLPKEMQLVLLDTAQSMVNRLEIDRENPTLDRTTRSLNDIVADAEAKKVEQSPSHGPTSPDRGR